MATDFFGNEVDDDFDPNARDPAAIAPGSAPDQQTKDAIQNAKNRTQATNTAAINANRQPTNRPATALQAYTAFEGGNIGGTSGAASTTQRAPGSVGSFTRDGSGNPVMITQGTPEGDAAYNAKLGAVYPGLAFGATDSVSTPHGGTLSFQPGDGSAGFDGYGNNADGSPAAVSTAPGTTPGTGGPPIGARPTPGRLRPEILSGSEAPMDPRGATAQAGQLQGGNALQSGILSGSVAGANPKDRALQLSELQRVQQFFNKPQAGQGVMSDVDAFLASRSQGPSAAQAQLSEAADQSMSDNLSLARSTRGGARNVNRNMRTAISENAATQQDLGRDSSQLRANEEQDFRNEFLSALGLKGNLAGGVDQNTLAALGLSAGTAGDIRAGGAADRAATLGAATGLQGDQNQLATGIRSSDLAERGQNLDAATGLYSVDQRVAGDAYGTDVNANTSRYVADRGGFTATSVDAARRAQQQAEADRNLFTNPEDLLKIENVPAAGKAVQRLAGF